MRSYRLDELRISPAFLFFGPLLERFRRGEGALIGVNAALLWAQGRTGLSGLAALLLSFAVLAALYSFNDLRDATDDAKNPKKNPRLVRAFVERQRAFSIWIQAIQVLLVIFAFSLLGARPALTLVCLFAVNTLYSLWLKGVSFVDVPVVGLWGGLYVGIVSAPLHVCVLVGLMTMIAHIFQILEDREIDGATGVRTTAVRSTRATAALLATTCAFLAVMLSFELSAIWGVTALFPLALYRGLAGTGLAWMGSRIYFGGVLLVVLGIVRVGPGASS